MSSNSYLILSSFYSMWYLQYLIVYSNLPRSGRLCDKIYSTRILGTLENRRPSFSESNRPYSMKHVTHQTTLAPIIPLTKSMSWKFTTRHTWVVTMSQTKCLGSRGCESMLIWRYALGWLMNSNPGMVEIETLWSDCPAWEEFTCCSSRVTGIREGANRACTLDSGKKRPCLSSRKHCTWKRLPGRLGSESKSACVRKQTNKKNTSFQSCSSRSQGCRKILRTLQNQDLYGTICANNGPPAWLSLEKNRL